MMTLEVTNIYRGPETSHGEVRTRPSDAISPLRERVHTHIAGVFQRLRSQYGTIHEIVREDTFLTIVGHPKNEATGEIIYRRYAESSPDEQIPCGD